MANWAVSSGRILQLAHEDAVHHASAYDLRKAITSLKLSFYINRNVYTAAIYAENNNSGQEYPYGLIVVLQYTVL